MSNKNSFKMATLAASIALAMASASVMAAAPTATQLPGQGTLVTAGTASTTYTTGATMNIVLTGNTVIDWGKGTDFNKTGVAGFNIGSGGTVNFTGAYGALNIDSSGNPSQIFGKLTGVGNLYVANANGIIVGATAQISSTANVGLIANTLGATAFDGTAAPTSIEYQGAGGDVSVAKGATINGTNVLVSGGGVVNVDLSAFAGGAVTLNAGVKNSTSTLVHDNTGATLTAAGTQAGGTLASFASAGNASSSGMLELGSNARVDGTLTNTGALTLATGFAIDGALVNNKTVTQSANVSMGSLTNNGTINGATFALNTTDGALTNSGQITTTGAISVTGGDLTNNGQISVNGTSVAGGNLVNGGAITGGGTVNVTGGNVTNSGSMAAVSVQTINGSIVNNGTITGGGNFETSSDASAASFTKGADYSITNNGTITSWNNFYIAANNQWQQTNAKGVLGTALNGSTGSFTNTGTLQVASSNSRLQVYTNNNISLGGKLQTVNGTTVTDVSASNPLISLDLEAAGYSNDKVFTSDGVLTVSTPVAVNTSTGVVPPGYAFLVGSQVSLLSNISNVDDSGNPAGYVSIVAGAQQASGYAVRVGTGVTISALNNINVNGDVAGNNPNVLINGTLAANTITFGMGDMQLGFSAPHPAVAISDLFTGPSGSLVMANNPYLYINSTGRVKTVPYNNASNFRFNGLSVNVTDGTQLLVDLNPSAYQTNGTSNGLSAVNLLVNSDVMLYSDVGPAPVTAGGSAVTGVTNTPNTHLVLQSSGNIEVGDGGDFYWPGYVYLGNVAADADGNALPGTLGLGTIKTDGEFNNVLPGDIAGASGIHFITQFPMVLGGDVVTNANAWVNFGTDLLTQAYAGGTLGDGQFFGGKPGSGTVVNYGPLAASNFVTQAPSATP